MEIRKTKQELFGENRVRRVVGALISASQWFEVTPYPDDLWIITVKYENEEILRRLIANSGPLEKQDGERTEADEARRESREVPSS